jgi:hypothetical protein
MHGQKFLFLYIYYDFIRERGERERRGGVHLLVLVLVFTLFCKYFFHFHTVHIVWYIVSLLLFFSLV